MEWGQISSYRAANKEHILPANFPNDNHMCWAEGPLYRQGEAQKPAEGAWQRIESNLHTAEDGARIWQSTVEGLSLVKHRRQKSSPGQQVIKKMLSNLPMGGIVVHCHQPPGMSGNFCKQTSSNIYIAGVHFRSCLRHCNFKAVFWQQLIPTALNNFWHAAGFCFPFFSLVFFFL